MECFSLGREGDAAPAPAPPAPAPTGGNKKRPGGRAGKGGSSRPPVVEDISYNPCAVAIDEEAVKTWVYPTNVELRAYQKSMVEKALFTNTLVALPTGLGKTFIAAVVMYNYFRWFPEGKIVFTAPSRPLVTQQIEACHNTVGIPQEWTIDMKGNRSPTSRSQLWETKRVFFVTPQVLENDIKKGTCKKEKIVCLVIDEAHRASGNYAYCTAVRELVAARVPLRILALTATPGSKHADIQNVLSNLCISDLVYYDEEDSEVSRYINTRQVDLVKVPFDSNATEVDTLILDILRPRLSLLRDFGVIDHRDPAKWTPYGLLEYKNRFNEAPPPNTSGEDREEILKCFLALGSILHVRKLLLSHGIKQAYQFLEDKFKKGSLSLMRKNELFWKLKDKMKHISSQGSPRKIQELIRVVEDHFKTTGSKESRVIVFSHFRGSVKEICLSLQSIDDRLIRPVEFIGQSTVGKQLKGQSQKMQQAILKKFRSGEYNVLVATSIGEEGLDIIEVDLVICFDANVSPLRMIQRMGRTGRKHEGRVVVLACEGPEARGYSKKQGDSRTMRKLLRNSERFEYHASPRMVPHVFTPEMEPMKLKIPKYIHGSKKTKDTVNGASPILGKMSEEDSRLFAQYFGACREDIWKPSLVAFPRFQLSPSIVHKVPHSFRTTDMLIDAMQQLQDVSFMTKSESPFKEPASVSAVKDQAHEGLGLNAVNGSQEATVQEYDGLEASSREIVWNQNVCLPGSPAKTYPVHSFFNGQYVTVDRGGNVSVTFVPVLPHTSACHKDTKNVSLCCSVKNMVVGSKSAADFSKPTVEFDRLAYSTYSGKQIMNNSASNLAPHSYECAGQGDNVDEVVITTPSETSRSPRDKWDTPCSARLESSTFFRPEDSELSPRLTRYMEEGTVPESPVLDFSPLQEPGEAVDAGPVLPLKPLGVGMQASAAGYQKEPLLHEKNNGLAEEPACPSNGKLHTPSTHTHTSTNQLCDSFSNDFQLKSVGDTSGSVQQAPKYRRLCKYGDKIKKVSSNCLDDEFGAPDLGNKGKAKRRLDTYIDEEVEVSEDADVSEDEDCDQSEDRYEDSFIDDQETPAGEFTETGQGNGKNGDMMGFYRQSLLTQTPLVLPSRYLDASDSSISNRTSSETGHNSVARIETPTVPCPMHHIMDSSPSSYRQRSMEGASAIRQKTETTIGNCESSSNMNCRKRKLSFQQPLSIPVINLELEPTPQHSVHLATGTSDDLHMDDAFFEGLDLDAIEAQATEKWKQKTTQSMQIQVETKKASEISFAPPSFDLGL